MKYFNEHDLSSAIGKIVEECFNIEAKKRYMTNGILVDKNTSIPNYPSFVIDNTKVMLSLSMGFIFLPSSIITKFSIMFNEKINVVSNMFKSKYGSDHLQTYSALESGSDHFTLLKSKNNIEGSHLISDLSKIKSCKRCIFINNDNASIEKIVGKARFIWIIYSFEQLINDLSNYQNRKIPLIAQLSSVMYDPYKVFNLANDTLKISNITHKDFNNTRPVLSLYSNGLITSKEVEDYVEISIDINNINEIRKQTFMLTLKNNIKYPEFLLGWFHNINIIKVCPIRKMGFELIKYFGDGNVCDNSMYNHIHPILQDIYVVDINDVNIINSATENKKNDCCYSCGTLLYDNIYLIFNDKTSIDCLAYCPICIHSKFVVVNDMYNRRLYNAGDIIARTIYPVNAVELINKMNIDESIKEIYRYIQTNNVKLIDGKYIVINTPTKKYLGWDCDIYNYYNYILNNDIGYKSHTIFRINYTNV